MYSAESVVAALKANKELSCEGIDGIGCPSPIPHVGCEGIPEKCDLCMNKKCKQQISVHRKFQKLAVLNLMYMIAPQNHDGFISKDDSTLKQLIKYKFIDVTLLKPVQ
jgi:hypothetical protein